MQSALSSGPASVASKVHVLESDGVCRYFFAYLLKMQKQLRAIKEHRESLGLSAMDLGRLTPAPGPNDEDDSNGLPFFSAIPDTVVYEHDFPQAWYTYDVKTKELAKQSGKYLDAMEIYKGFSSVAPGCGEICAQFIGVYKTGNNATITTDAVGSTFGSSYGSSRFLSPLNNASGTEVTEITYFTPESLMQWLREKSPQRPKEGLLQVFIPPRGERNDCLQMTWSPTTSFLLRRANLHPLNSIRVEPRKRCGTFDAQPHLVEETVGNDLLKSKISDSLSQVAVYLLKAEHKIVSRMVIHFKHDRDGLLWMQFGSSMRVENSEIIGSTVVRDPVDLDTAYDQPPSLCPNSAIDTALRFQTSMASPSERWRRFNTVHNAGGAHRFVQRTLQRRDTKHLLTAASQWSPRKSASQAPQELTLLGSFIEDTLYTLYAARMTTSREVADGFDVVVQLPARLVTFLDTQGRDHLMVDIFGMEAVEVSASSRTGVDANAAATSSSVVDAQQAAASALYRLIPKGTRRPLSIVRSECEAFVTHLRSMYTV